MTWEMAFEVRNAALDAAAAGPRKRKSSRMHTAADSDWILAAGVSFEILVFFFAMAIDRRFLCEVAYLCHGLNRRR